MSARSLHRMDVGRARAGIGAVLGVALTFGVAASVGAQSLDNYPDLVADAPENVQGPAEITWQGEDLLAVRFDGFVTNIGGGPLHVQGNPQPSAFGTPGAVAQHILDGSGTSIAEFPLDTTGSTPAVQYQTSDDHGHWHLMRVMEYSLWDASKTTQILDGSKIGFCLFDSERISGSVPGVYDGGGDWCAGSDFGGGPDATYLEMGVSSGWRDIYSSFINLQWVDVSDVAPGTYYLAALADPNSIVAEADETNNSYSWTSTTTIVPGYLAANVGPLAATGPKTVTLSAASFELVPDPEPHPLGARTFVIATPPSHGTLNVTAGSPFTSATITYTPDGGYTGEDSFTYYAFDPNSVYPRNPAAHSATVTLDVDTSGEPLPPPPAFDDVPAGHRFVEAITWMATQGITLGCGDGNFCPDDAVTRGQIASFFARAFQLTDGAGDDLFVDDDGSVHEDNIDLLATAEITFGCAANLFCPTADVTRGQFASLLVRATGLTGGAGDDFFTDDDGNTHESNIDILAFNEVTSGCTATTFCPADNLTRGQLAQLLFRAIGS